MWSPKSKEKIIMANKLIVLEGACDGVGKSTQLELLKSSYPKEDAITQHFPAYESISSSLVQAYLEGKLGEVKDISSYAILSYYALDREYVWRNILKPAYDSGKTILLDRYTTSSLIYQSALIKTYHEKVRFLKFAMDYEYRKLKIQKPDQVIFLNADFEVIQRQLKARKENVGVTNDIHERDTELMYQFYQSALWVANYLKWDQVMCTENNQMRSKEEIHQDILKLVHKN